MEQRGLMRRLEAMMCSNLFDGRQIGGVIEMPPFHARHAIPEFRRCSWDYVVLENDRWKISKYFFSQVRR